jgi:hypothetical protein
VVTAESARLARISGLTREQAISALHILAGYTAQGTDFALDVATTPVAAAPVADVLAFRVGTPKTGTPCARCGDTQFTVLRAGRWECWDRQSCVDREASNRTEAAR